MDGTLSNLTAIDLCAGCGALSDGLQQAGFDVQGVEVCEDAAESHRRNVGPCVVADIRTWTPPARVMLVAGGPPCQPFSNSGLRAGLDDPRYLVPSFARIARAAQAEAVMLENVRGLYGDPQALAAVLGELRAAGYHTKHTLLNAADYGVPQARVRLFVVGFRDPQALRRFQWPLPTHTDKPSLFGLRPHVTVRQALGLSGRYIVGRKEGVRGGNSGVRYIDVDRPAPTVVAGSNVEMLWHETQGITRLTTEQCAVLQGFPASWEFAGNKGSQQRQVGNAVPPVLARAVASSIVDALGLAELQLPACARVVRHRASQPQRNALAYARRKPVPMSTTTIPTAIAVKLNLFEQLAALNVDVTVRESGAIEVQPRPLAKTEPTGAGRIGRIPNGARPTVSAPRTRAPRKAAVKPAKRSARKVKPAAPVAAEPVKAAPRAKKAKVQGVPSTAQKAYDAIAAGASTASEIRERAGLTPGEHRHAMAMLTKGKIPGLRAYMHGDRSKSRYGTSPEQAKARFDAAENPPPEPRKSLHVPPKKRVRREAMDAALAAVE